MAQEGGTMSVRSNENLSGTMRAARLRRHRYQAVATVAMLVGALTLSAHLAYAATPTCFGQAATITGTAGDDPSLTGTAGGGGGGGAGGQGTRQGGGGDEPLGG